MRGKKFEMLYILECSMVIVLIKAMQQMSEVFKYVYNYIVFLT
jgi:hypothetical protein